MSDERLSRILPLLQRPARYTGGEWNQIVSGAKPVKIALAYPDVYEIGMSNLGLRILYELVNEAPDFAAERVFAPWTDMEAAMRENDVPLISLETKTPIRLFDIFGFSLQTELTYTNILNMIELAGLDIRADRRQDSDPLVVAGGPGAFNPEPLSPFFDLFVIGEGEEVVLELLRTVKEHKDRVGRSDRSGLLESLARIDGVYVPSLVEAPGDYPLKVKNRPLKIEKRVISDFNAVKMPSMPVVPFLETIHDRCVLEIMRGCTRGCRFCQAGVIYRPFRERSVDTIKEAARAQMRSTGYDEISLASLSTTDHSQIEELVESVIGLSGATVKSVSLPSLRIDRLSVDLAEKIATLKRTGLTFAPEAGSERLRRVINKGLSRDEIIETSIIAFKAGWVRIKLYFMIGLPGETEEDIGEIAELVEDILKVAADELGRQRARQLKLTVSVSSFVPKPHTPFQWAEALGYEKIKERQEMLRARLPRKRVSLKWHDAGFSLVEAAISRGGQEVSAAIENAYRLGARFDSWSDQFSFDLWERAFTEAGLDLRSYAARGFDLGDALPWAHIDSGVDPLWLRSEYEKALRAEETQDCRAADCSGCGVCEGDLGLEFAPGGRPVD